MVASADKLAKGLPTAQEMMEKLALAEAEKASEEARKHAAAEAEKRALLDKLTKPSGLSDEEVLKRARVIIIDFPDGVPGDVGISLKWV